MAAWLQAKGFGFVVPNAAWGEPVADVGQPTPIPQPGSPEIPDGSEIKVPVPGSEGPVLVKRPGETEFVPVATAPAKPVQTWVGGAPIRAGGNGEDGLIMSEGFPATAGPSGNLGWLLLLGAGVLVLKGRKRG